VARRRKSKGLGESSAKHAAKAVALIDAVESATRQSRSGSCSIRFTSLHNAIEKDGRMRAHAFGSGGRVAKGALTSKTISTADAKRVYAASDDLTRAVQEFRSDCVKRGS
jgi:hypothetical protein